MKFFKVHSQKMKNDKIICLQDKFTDIGPDGFDGFAVERLVLADTTKFIRDYAFSGIGECCIYLPKSIEEIETLAFENMSPSVVFYCAKGSYAEQVCMEHNLNISNDVGEVSKWKDEQLKAENEERIKREQLEKERLERERLEKERMEKERLEKERLEKERLEKERLERERLEKERLEKERLEKERLEKERLEREKEEQAKKQQQPKPAPAMRKIKAIIFDDANGLVTEMVNFEELPDGAKSLVVNNEIHIYRQYDNDKVKKNYITKNNYNLMVEQKRFKDAIAAGEKPYSRPQDKTITMYIYDKANGIRTQIVDYEDFPEKELGNVVNNEVFVYKTIVNGRVEGKFVSKADFEIIKGGGEVKSVQKKTCPQCNAVLQETDNFCTNCGKNLKDAAPKGGSVPEIKSAKFCTKCGKKNESKYYFCVDCGNKL